MNDSVVLGYILEAFRFAAWTGSLLLLAALITYKHPDIQFKRPLNLQTLSWLGVCAVHFHLFFSQWYWWLWQRSISDSNILLREALVDKSWIMVGSYFVLFCGLGLLLSPTMSRDFSTRYVLSGVGVLVFLMTLSLLSH